VKNSSYIGFRLAKQTKNLLEKVTLARGEDISDFVRRAVLKELASLGFLSNQQTKALGMSI